MLDRVRGVAASDTDRSTTRFGDWYVNVMFFEPQLALFVIEVTLLPVLMPSAPAATLLDRFPPTLMASSGPRSTSSFAEPELAEMLPCRFAKTTSRSLLSVIDEFRFLADAYIKLGDETDPMSLSLRSAETPCGPLYKRHVTPDRELAALVSARPALAIPVKASESRGDRRTLDRPRMPARQRHRTPTTNTAADTVADECGLPVGT